VVAVDVALGLGEAVGSGVDGVGGGGGGGGGGVVGGGGGGGVAGFGVGTGVGEGLGAVIVTAEGLTVLSWTETSPGPLPEVAAKA
jgi:hypothetical protein